MRFGNHVWYLARRRSSGPGHGQSTAGLLLTGIAIPHRSRDRLKGLLRTAVRGLIVVAGVNARPDFRW